MNNTQYIEEDEIDLGKLFGTLKKHLFSIFLITLLITALAAAYAYFAKPIYSSDVTIAFSDEKSSKLTAIVPTDLAGAFGSTEKELETVKLTLETRKFINSAINNLDISQRYYVEQNYKKNAVYEFENLKVNLEIHDDAYQKLKKETLYGEYFQITPIDNTQYRLTVDALDINRLCTYGKSIYEEYFTIVVTKEGDLPNGVNYYVTKSDTSLLADEILKNLTTTILSENVLKIAYQDTVPRRAKEIVEEIAESFRAFTLKKKTSELSQTLSFLNKEIKKIESVLKGEGKNLKDYQTKSNAFLSVESNNVALFENITKKEELIKNLELQLEELKKFKVALHENQFNTISLLNSGIQIGSIQSLIELFRADEIELTEMQLQANNIEKSITKNVQLSQLIEKYNKQKKLLEELRFSFTEGHPQVQKAASDLVQLEIDIRHYIEVNIDRLETNRAAIKDKILHNIITTEQNIRTKLDMLNSDVQKDHKLLKTLPAKNFDIQELKRKFNFSENIYTFLLQKKMEMEISLASTIANTQIIENAREALKASKPNKKLIVIVGFITGLILAIFITFFRAMMDRKIRDEESIRELTDAPIYGVLPQKREERFFVEALKNIRTNIQFILKKDSSCVNILITSTIPGEGKTTVISGLADVIAQANKKVLLMDLDLRKPRLYQELKKSNKRGMTQYLTSNLELFDCIQNVAENLDFFPAGAVPPNPSELLMSDKFKETIEKLKEEYDYILFDTAPIGTVLDANILLEYTDIVLLVVRANMAEKAFIEGFNHLIKEKGVKSAGIILNDLKQGKTTNYGYGNYGYGNYGYGNSK